MIIEGMTIEIFTKIRTNLKLNLVAADSTSDKLVPANKHSEDEIHFVIARQETEGSAYRLICVVEREHFMAFLSAWTERSGVLGDQAAESEVLVVH